MLRYFLTVFVVFTFCCTCLGSCGGGSGGTMNLSQTLKPQLENTAGAPKISITANREEWARKAAGLKREIVYNYSREGYPNDRGFTAVAMRNDYEPYEPGVEDLELTVYRRNDEKLSVKLMAHGHDNVLAHLWFDPAQWRVEGVISRNPWPTKDFVALPACRRLHSSSCPPPAVDLSPVAPPACYHELPALRMSHSRNELPA